MTMRVACPTCSSAVTAPDAAAGKVVKCPKCKSPMLMPESELPVAKIFKPPSPVPANIYRVAEDDRPRPKLLRRRRDEDDEAPSGGYLADHPDQVGLMSAGAVVVVVFLLWVCGAFRSRAPELATASGSGSAATAVDTSNPYKPGKPTVEKLASRLPPLDGWSTLDIPDLAINVPGKPVGQDTHKDERIEKFRKERQQPLGVTKIDEWVGLKTMVPPQMFLSSFHYSRFHVYAMQTSLDWDTMPESELIDKVNHLLVIFEKSSIDPATRIGKQNLEFEGRPVLELRHQRTETYIGGGKKEDHIRYTTWRAFPLGKRLIVLMATGYDGGPPAELTEHFFNSLKIKPAVGSP